MFLKIIRIRPRLGAEHQLRQSIERLLIPMAQSSANLIQVYPGQRIDQATGEFVFATVWTDEARARSFCAGGAPDEQRYLVESWASEVYEAFCIHGAAWLSIDA
jgi:quinol monooxygenase YgiN